MHQPRYQKILLIIILLGLLLPFVDKPVHMDDPLFLWAAQHIVDTPGDFYGFQVNWYGHEKPMSEVMKNPPLLSYYLALVGKIFGWREVALHLSLLVPGVFLILGLFALSSQLCRQPFWASLAAITAPVFLISSSTLMSDVLMLTFWVWAVVFWRRGLRKNRSVFLGAAAILITLAALTKYYGISLVPLLFLYSLIYYRGFRRQLLFLLIPLGILAGFHWLTASFYGRGLVLDSVNYALERNPRSMLKIIIGLSFLGGCLFNTLFYSPLLWKRNYLLAGLSLALIIFSGLCVAGKFGRLSLVNNGAYKWENIIQAGLFILAGLNILALTWSDFYDRRDADSILLGLWVIGTLIFACLVNWGLNARSILPLTPAVAILLLRRLERRGWVTWLQTSWKPLVIFVPAALLAFMVAWSDYQFAKSAKSAASKIAAEFRGYPGKVWFEGHWGFQYYMLQNGATPLDVKESLLKVHDLIVAPVTTNTNVSLLDPPYFTLAAKMSMPVFPWLTVLNDACGAGFYSDAFGPLPFAFNRVPSERYFIYLFSQAQGQLE